MFLTSLWKTILGFSFYYPMLMAYLWMIGALSFYRTAHHQGIKKQPKQFLPFFANLCAFAPLR